MENTKIDLKKVQKGLFNVKRDEFKEVYCDDMYYIAIDGEGNPNSEIYSKKIVSLYKVAYGVKMDYKKLGKDFVVMPLSGLWWSDNYEDFIEDNKEGWKWTMLIQLPEFVLEKDIEEKKKSLEESELGEYIKKIKYIKYHEGKGMQTLYVGPYSEEGEVVKTLHEKIKEKGFKLRGKHHEIYLSDPRKTDPKKLKTIIRQGIE